MLQEAYADLAGSAATIGATYASAWWGSEGGLAAAVAASRDDDVRRRITLVGPHRDDVTFTIGALPARTHASQGEQRSLALALRLSGHAVVTEAVGEPPILLLDDVFSELDPGRSHALVEHLPAGQAVLTTASGLPAGAEPELVVEVAGGRVRPSGVGTGQAET